MRVRHARPALHNGAVTGIAELPEPPYTAVIFSAQRTEGDQGYAATAERMDELARQQPGFLGVESARDADGFGITVSYWADDAAARAWKQVHEHAVAQQRGRELWYADYQVRVATVGRAYGPA
jgi:heme-degrading monooxygenase HmoA